jgi:hypothetical protein
MEEIFESPVSFEEVEILKTYPVFINVADVDEPEHYFRLDLVDSDVVGPGRFVSPVEILFTPRPHFVISPLQVSGHIERPDNRVVWGNSFMLALYDPTRDTAWTIGSVAGRHRYGPVPVRAVAAHVRPDDPAVAPGGIRAVSFEHFPGVRRLRLSFL